MASTGYEQLYFLLVIMQFYLVFPLVLVLLRRTSGHHGRLIAAAAVAQVAISILTQWRWLPPLLLKYQNQDVLEYALYLAGGCVVACHLEQVDAWVRGHARLILALTAVAGLAAEGALPVDRRHRRSRLRPAHRTPRPHTAGRAADRAQASALALQGE